MTDCCHRWLVSSPTGKAELDGYCPRCGSRRTFPAVLTQDPKMSKLKDGARK